MHEGDALSIRCSQKYFSGASFAAHLLFIKSHFGFLTNTTISLEAKHISYIYVSIKSKYHININLR